MLVVCGHPAQTRNSSKSIILILANRAKVIQASNRILELLSHKPCNGFQRFR